MRKLLLAVTLLLPAGSAAAQGMELGAGIAGIGYRSPSTGHGLTTIGLGGFALTTGFYLSPGIAFEPATQFAYARSNGQSLTQLDLGVGLPFYTDKGYGHKGTYFAPEVGVTLYDDGNYSAKQFRVGASVGQKMEISDNASFRVGLRVAEGLKNNDYNSIFSITAFFGFSVFLKQ